MVITLKLALRNIFRNSRRTWLTVGLIACGLATLMFTDAMVKGISQAMVQIATGTFLGEAQVHRTGFRENNDVDLFLPDTEELLQSLRELPTVKVAAPRILAGAMLASAQNVAGAMVYGIDPGAEAALGKIKQAMVQGEYLSGLLETEILLGDQLADLLEVEMGDRVVVTVSQSNGGELAQELFRVSGIFRFNDRMLDQNLAFINLSSGQRMLAIDNGVHEIALGFTQQKNTIFPWQQFNHDQLETLSWRELIPQLSGVLNMSDISALIVAGILFVLVSLGLINSMFMSIYERQYEFGVLLALGTRRSQLFCQILWEGFFLGILSALAGVVLGGGLSYWKAVTGIDYGNLEMSGVTLQEPIYLVLSWQQFTLMPLIIIVMTVTACIYPALHAARLVPTDAMRKTL